MSSSPHKATRTRNKPPSGGSRGGRSWRALCTREHLGWAFYDWANSAFVLTIITVIGPAYFISLFNRSVEPGGLRLGDNPALQLGGWLWNGEALWSALIGFAALAVALSAPWLGALADAQGTRKRFLILYCCIGTAATLGLAWDDLLGMGGMPFWIAGGLIILGSIAFEGGNVYYNSFLPDLASAEAEQDLLSSLGYALGYLGGAFVLAMCLLWFVPPQGELRYAFLLVGAWWGGFGLLSSAMLRERRRLRGAQAWLYAAGELRRLVGQLRQSPHTLRFLIAFLLYNDGIATLISNTTPYAMQHIYRDASLSEKVGLTDLIPLILLIQLLAAPGAMAFAWLSTYIGTRKTLLLSLSGFLIVALAAPFIHLLWQFQILAVILGLVLGATQALSRSLFAGFIPPGKTTEYFSLFALSSKFSAVGGPFVYTTLVLFTGSSRAAVFSLSAFFGLGAWLLWRIDPRQAEREAQREN